jgi:hypothetical protein
MTQPLGLPDPSTPDDFAREALVIQRLRDTLPADAQAKFFKEFEELLTLAAEPRCAETQADGVPCGTLDADCEHCGRALGWLSRLRAEIARTAP